MPDQKLSGREKVLTRMSRDGAVEENASTGEKNRVSKRAEDHSYKTGEMEGSFSGQRKSFARGRPDQDHEKKQSRRQRQSADKEKADHADADGSKSESESSTEAGGAQQKTRRQLKYEKKESRYGEKIQKTNNRLEKLQKKKPAKRRLRWTAEEVKEESKKGSSAAAQEPGDSGGAEGIVKAKGRSQVPKVQKDSEFARAAAGEEERAGPDAKFRRRLRIEKTPLTQKEWEDRKKKRHKQRVAAATPVTVPARMYIRKIRQEADDDMRSAMDKGGSGGRFFRRHVRKNVRNLKKRSNIYVKEHRLQERVKRLEEKQGEARYKQLSKPDQKAFRKLQKQLNKRKYQAAAYQKAKEAGWTNIRHKNRAKRAYAALKRFARTTKTVLSVFGSMSFLFLLFFVILILICVLMFQSCSQGSAIMYVSTYQSDYTDISDCSAYMKKLETDLKERIDNIEEIEEPDCYEYIYDLDDIGHNPFVLLSYLASKYEEDFNFAMVKSDIEAVFDEMYTLTIEKKIEERSREKRDPVTGNIIYGENGKPEMEYFDATICYVTLRKKPLEEIVEENLNAEQKERYELYMMSKGGQQVYESPLPMDWSGLISSPFGERIHPISGERKFHNGVDIAVPTGTELRSATTGVVVASGYQADGAGYYINVQSETGWIVKYMHLSEQAVSVGDPVEKGDYLGRTGNSGNSTGPHLHLEVRDAENKPINPMFIVPQVSKDIDDLFKEEEGG